MITRSNKVLITSIGSWGITYVYTVGVELQFTVI